jgi:HK97 gp10 family phage protein
MIGATATFTPGAVDAGTILAAVVAGVAIGAKIIEEEAKSICPVDTGALQASIQAQEPVTEGNQVTAEIIAGEHYAAYVEYGTGERGAASAGAGEGPYSPHWPGMAAQPYMRPPLDTRRGDVFDAIAQEVAGAL